MKLQQSSHKKLSTWFFLFTSCYTWVAGVAWFAYVQKYMICLSKID